MVPGGNHAAGLGRSFGEPVLKVEARCRPCSLPVALQVISCAPLPGGCQARRCRRKIACPCGQISRRWGSPFKARLEHRSMQVQALAAGDDKGHCIPPVAGDLEAPLIRKPRQVIHHVHIRPDPPGTHRDLKMINKTQAGIQCGVDSRAAHLRPTLHQVVRCTEDPVAAGVKGIRPGEAVIDQILQRQPIPQGALGRAGWMGIVAHGLAIGPEYHARHGKIDLQPPRVSMGRDIAGRTRAGRNTGPCKFEYQAQGQVHLPSQDRVTGIEGRRIDVIACERQHEAGIPMHEGEGGQNPAQGIGATDKNLRRRVTQDRLALCAELLHHRRRIHVSGERSEAIGPSRLSGPPTIM